MKEGTGRQSRRTWWLAACWLVPYLATGLPGKDEFLYFEGKPLHGVISSGRNFTWVWKPPPIGAGVIKPGAGREVFGGFVDAKIKADQKVIGASATRQQFTLKAFPEAEGKQFKGEVTFEVQQQVFRGPGNWQNVGGPQTKTVEIQLFIAQSTPAKIVVAAKLSNDIKMAGDARAIDVKPSTSTVADVEIRDPRQPIVVGKRTGSQKFTLRYQIGAQRLDLPLVVEVVHKEISVALRIDEGEAHTVQPARLEAGTGLTDWKLLEILGVKHSAIAAAKKDKEALVLTGRDAGSTRVSAIFSARDAASKSERPLKIKVKLEVGVAPIEQVPIPR